MKEKRIYYNAVAGLFSQIISIGLGLLIPRLFLKSFGSEMNGVTSTINQIFNYLWLLESGVGLATLQALYQPVAQTDHPAINSIISATGYYYRKTGYLYLGLVLIFGVIYSFSVRAICSPWTIFFIILLIGLPSVLSYFFQAKYKMLLEAEGKAYIQSNITTIGQFVLSFGKVIILYFSDNILLLYILQCACSVLQMLVFLIYINRNYKWLDLKHAKPNFEAISQKSSVLLHQISGVVFNNTDIILLSVFCDFKIVSVYTIYNLFFKYAEKIITSISSSINFSLGQMFFSNRERFRKLFDIYESCYMIFVFIIYTMIYLFIIPFITLYTSGIDDVNYVDPLLPLFFILVNLFANGKIPCNQVLIFAGEFDNTRDRAVIEASINIIVSIIAIQFFGIYGGLFGTIMALFYRGNDMIFYANHRILNRSVWVTYRKWFVNLFLFICIKVLLNPCGRGLNSYKDIFVWCIPYGILVVLIYSIVSFLLYPELFAFFYEYMKQKIAAFRKH